ncbi:MAG: IS66 family transposase [Gammaproteobacteria bacterium]|nr:MAG: IS66 family transposase [Gammaproteobacteria bacterium]
MKTAPETLPDNTETLKNLLLSERAISQQKDAEINQLKQQYQQILEQWRLSQDKRFGKSSEVSIDQFGLFNEVEQLDDETDGGPAEQETVTYLRNKPKRTPLPKDLPREVIVHDIDEADKICDGCGSGLHKMGEDKSEQLEFIPAQIKVIEHVRPKYSCRHCEQQGTEVKIKIAPVPVSAIPKSMATASLLSFIISNKYQYALPLYRQESLFKQYGIALSRQTMANWMLKLTPLLNRVVQRYQQILLQQSVIHADETPLKVINEDKVTSYMWVYCTGCDSPSTDSDKNKPTNLVLYDYQPSRSGQCARDYLNDYSGYLQVDGYAGYEKNNATLVGCWAHARRKFIEAQKAQVKGKTGKADWAINHIKKLYRIEADIKQKTAQEKQAIRKNQSMPLLNQLKTWLDKSALQVPPKSAVGKAIAYSLRQWPKLNRYTENGYLSIDNNRAERAVKPFVIGRKNWLFSNTPSGARASAMMYSVVETAKANGLIPFDYLRYLLEQLPTNPENIDYLLPWNVVLTKD